MISTQLTRVFLVIATSSILWCCSSTTTLAERMHTVAEFMRQDIDTVEEQLAEVRTDLDALPQSPALAPLRERERELAARLADTEGRMEASLDATDKAGFHQTLEDLTAIRIDTDRLVSDTMLVER